MDFTNVNALQARAYMAKSGIQEEHLAKIVVRSRKNGARNPFARENQEVTEAGVMKSPMLADPVRELHHYPVTDWAVAFLLSNEQRARNSRTSPSGSPASATAWTPISWGIRTWPPISP
jgi:acetyl-CoA C-acetyltransferase